MDSDILQYLAAAAVAVGTFFSLVGVLGFIRLPDVYTRLHATGKVGVFGVVFLLIAAVIHTPLGWGKGLFLVFFLLVTGAVTAHALASAAYHLGLPMKGEMEGDRDVDPAGPEVSAAVDPPPYNREP